MATVKTAPAVGDGPNEFHKDVVEFSGHCAYIRSVYRLATRIWRDSTEGERKMMEDTAPSVFLNLGQVLAEYAILSACRVTDPANEGGKNENFTVEMFVNSFPTNSPTFKQLEELHQQMNKHRNKILPARHKFVAHADRAAIRKGIPLGTASWKEWDGFWSTLAKFIRIVNEKTIGTPYDIEVAGVPGDAEMLIKSLQQSEYFKTLLNGSDEAVKGACLKVALPNA